MSEEIKEVINRFIKGRNAQLLEMDVIKMTHALRKEKAIEEADKARAVAAMAKLDQAKEELQEEITLLEELLK